MTDCAIVIWRLVPYLDARFAAAAARCDLTVVEFSNLYGSQVWADGQQRSFEHIALAGGDTAEPPVAALEDALDRMRPSVVAVQGWSDKASYVAMDWALRNQRRIIMMSESNRYDHKRAAWSEWLKARILGACDSALVGGRDHADYLVDLGFEAARISQGYNVIDNAHFAPPGAAPVVVSRPYFLIVSRLVENKNIELALRAFADYRAACTRAPWDLVVLGTGPLQGHLEGVIGELGLGGVARLEGFRKYHELPALYQGAGALIQASTWEPWGLAVNEAMASGLPVIVSRMVGCQRELVRDGVNGFLFDPADRTGLARHMLALADGSVDRVAFGRESLRLIDEWGPQRFGGGFATALEIARNRAIAPPLIGRLVLKALVRNAGRISAGRMLADRANIQNRSA